MKSNKASAPAMEFFCLVPADNDEGICLRSAPSPAVDRWPLDDGKAVADWNERLFLIILQPGVRPDFQRVSADWHAVSKKFRDIVAPLVEDAVQFLPVRQRSIVGEVTREACFIMNYVHIAKVLNLKHSVFEDGDKSRSDGRYEYLRQPVLDLKKARDYPVFRIAGSTDYIVYRGDVVEAMRRAKITGCTFEPIEAS